MDGKGVPQFQRLCDVRNFLLSHFPIFFTNVNFRGKTKSSFESMSKIVGKDLTIPYKPSMSSPFTLTMRLPTLFSRSSSKDDEIEHVRDFFRNENGSIAVSQAKCETHRIDISSHHTKKEFTLPFLDAMKALEESNDKSRHHKMAEFKRFIDEFGTHFAKRTILGVRLLFERRYSAKEKSGNSNENFEAHNVSECLLF